MSKLIVYTGDNPQCIEGFSDSCNRSCQGALHLRKGKPVTVTDDEFAFIKSNRSDLASKIRVVADKPDAPKASEMAPTTVQAVAEPMTAEVASAPESEKSLEEKYPRKKGSFNKTV